MSKSLFNRYNYGYVLKSIKKNPLLIPVKSSLDQKTILISGGTRGIGLSIGKSLASKGANIILLGKTQYPQPKLENTIYSAASQLQAEYPSCYVHGIACDIRKEEDIKQCFEQIANQFGNIDGAVLNASAFCLAPTLNQTKKEIDLMSQVNINGTFLMAQKCLEQIKSSNHGHLLTISPPLEMINNDDWWVNHIYYSMSKFNVSLMAKYWAKEFPSIGVNTLWPRTIMNTTPVRNILGGEEIIHFSRKSEIMGDAAAAIFLSDPRKCTGQNFIDDEVLVSLNKDVEKYRINSNLNEKDLIPYFFSN
jgi:citronellol/citronellal dehydrogenase